MNRPGSLRHLVRSLRTGQHLKLKITTVNKRPTLKKLQSLVDLFNAAAPVGSTVIYREIMPEGKDPGSDPQEFTVLAPAYIHQGHTAAVFLNGKSGFVDVTHITIPADA